MTTNVYVDGFNLYYGALRNTNYKWLDIAKFSNHLLSGHSINRIRYFTAKPLGLPNDPDIGVRNSIYMRALGTIPNLTIHSGTYRTREHVIPQSPLAYRRYGRPKVDSPLMVKVQTFEEKKTDVNIATRLLLDCFQGDFDEAVIV